MQELFSDLRNHQDIAAYRQTKSKMVCFLVIFLLLSNNSFGTKMLICDAFCDLVPFVQFEKRGGVLNLLKLTLLHECFSGFLSCTNGTKSQKAPYLRRVFHPKVCKMEITFSKSTTNTFINFCFFSLSWFLFLCV